MEKATANRPRRFRSAFPTTMDEDHHKKLQIWGLLRYTKVRVEMFPNIQRNLDEDQDWPSWSNPMSGNKANK